MIKCKFVTNYRPPVSHRFWSQFRNGFTIRCGRFALHIWHLSRENSGNG